MTQRGDRHPSRTHQGASDDATWAVDIANATASDPLPQSQAPDGGTLDAPHRAGDDTAPLRQVVFIDGSVPDAQLLARGVAPGVIAVVLDPALDGVQQIADWLTSHHITNLAAIDIVAHGQDGEIALGDTRLDAGTIADYTAQLAAIGAALQPGGDIQIYGCDVAQDAAGTAFLQQLSQATGGATIAAASHLVGAAAGGGSWGLDVNTGTIDVSAPFTAATMSAYPDELSLTTNQLFADFNAGEATSLTRIEQIGVTGTIVGTTTDVISDQSNTYVQIFAGLAIDAPLNEYFFIDNSDGVNPSPSGTDNIRVGSLSGGAPVSIFNAPTDFPGDYSLGGLALDQPNGYLYFGYGSAGPGTDNDTIVAGVYKINITTHAVTAVATSANVLTPISLSLDQTDNLIFFIDSDSNNQVTNNIDVGNMANGSVTTLNSELSASVQNILAVSNPNESFLTGIAVDVATHTLFFTASNGASTADDYIFSAPFTVKSGNVTITSVSTLYSGAAAEQPRNIVLDTQDSLFYIASGNAGSSSGIYESSMTPSKGASLTRVYQETTTSASPPADLAFLSTPTVTASGALSYIHNATAITLDSTATVTNADGQNLASATVSVAGGSSAFGDTMSATVSGTNIAFTFSSSTDTLTLTGNDTVAHYQQVLDSVTFSSTGATAGSRTIDWTVSDGIITSPTATSSVTVHDAPVVTAGTTVTFTGGGAAVKLDSGLTVSDASSATLASATVVIGSFVTGDTLTVGTPGGLSSSFSSGTLTLSGSASIATYQAALDSVAYSFAPSNGDPTVGNTHQTRSIAWTVNDGVLASTAATSTLDVVHAAPTITAGATVSYLGGSTAPVVLDAGLVLAAPDSGGDISSATITIGGSIAGDTLDFTNQNGISGSYANGVLTLSGVASVAAYQTALESVSYIFSPTTGDPTGGASTSRTITWSVNDGVVSSAGATSTLDVVHEPPVVTAGGTVTYPENAAPIVLDPGLTVSDPDSGGILTGASVSISSGFLAGDTLDFTDQNGITGTYHGGTGVLNLTGSATIAQYQAALQSVAYSFAGDPTNHLADNGRTISWTVTDGVGSSTAVTSSLTVLCFCAGTMIATPGGEMPVERLSAGDLVLTASGAVRPILWVGVGRQQVARGKRSAATPVIVERNAIGPNVPYRDLRVTKAHALFVDDVLIPVEFLVNHRSIRWDDRAQEVSLYHIELESHDVLVADGAPAESYRDDGNRWLFQNANAGWGLPPQEPCAPVLTGGPIVDAAWRRFLDRAGPRTLPPLTDDPDLHLLVDGQRIEAAARRGELVVFHLADRPGSVRIASRDAVPAELGLVRDPRSLGVALRRVTLRQGMRVRSIEASDGRLADGFHGYEPADDLRWTSGDAGIPLALFEGIDGALEVVLHLVGATRYPLFGEPARRTAA
ncbi:MAG: DUF4347 domain-containing protein [Acetobacteraceae bacterium]|nr:DUF4347 domain-containing protein [Acetobacteraceae bacterium]